MTKFLVAGAALFLLAGAAVAGIVRAHDGDDQAACRSHGPTHATKLDLGTSAGRDAPFLRRFQRHGIYVSLGPDSIRSIDRPCFESPAEAKPLLPETSLVIGIERNGDARAYPVDLLSYHEVVNDVVGGEPVAVTWCPLCASAVAFDRRAAGRTFEFGISGYLFRANQMLFDRQTGSLWSQLLGGAVTGRMRGTKLLEVPIVEQTWAAWLDDHPDTKVLSIRRDELATRFTHPYSYPTARGAEESDDPYGSYVSKVPIYFPHTKRGVPNASLVLGVVVDGHSKAYVMLALERRRALNDVVAGRPLLLTYDEGALGAAAYSRRLDGQTLDFRIARGRLADRQTESRWSPANARALSGPLKGKRLERVPAVPAYWFAWRQFHPATAIWKGKG